MTYKKILVFCAYFISGFSQTPSESLQRLLEGNQRYAEDQLLHPNHSLDRREELVEKQHPFATVLSCSDSRVAPEIIFDQGLGDLFVVRVAGNVVGPTELDSIIYSVKYLHSSVVFVLGHESCGAVTAVMENKTSSIKDIAGRIKPAIKGIKNLEDSIKANVRWVVSQLKKNKSLKPLIANGTIECVGAYYHLGTGRIEILTVDAQNSVKLNSDSSAEF